MDIALFTNGQKALLGKSNGVYSIIDPLLIFQNPDLFTDRFFFQLQRQLEINELGEIDKVIIALPGTHNTENNVIIKSYTLNDLSRIKIYDGFNFNFAFSNKLKPENIYLINDAFAATLGISLKLIGLQLPCIVLSIDVGVGIGFINNTKSIISTEWGFDYLPSKGKSIHDCLGKSSIYSLLLANKINVNENYTDTLFQTIQYLVHKYSESNENVKSIVILGEKVQYIDEIKLTQKLKEYHISVIYDTDATNEIILKGCLEYPDYIASQNNKVEKIQYFTGKEMIYDFEDFQRCRQHFISVKPLSNPDNYYKIIHTDGTTQIVAMRELNDASDLERYRF